ncbi:glycosyltransferase [bacterium]|nr:glycosyltransferase [bacterium]
MSGPIVTVVVPAYKRPDALRKAILSLLKQDMDPAEYEVIVVDSSPNDTNVKLVEELIPQAKCSLRVIHKEPEGPGPSRNTGAFAGKGRFIALMDSDCEATESWVRLGMEAFHEPAIGVVQGRTLPEPGVPTGVFSWYVKVDQPSFFWECTSLFYRREAFEQIGGFSKEYKVDDTFVIGGEDVDVALRVMRAGWKSRFAPEVLVYHEVQKMEVSRWLYNRRLTVWPMLTKKYPELRQHFFARYFYEPNQAYLLLALASILLAVVWNPWFAVGAIPYLYHRGKEPSATFRGLLRPLRVIPYLMRDLCSLFILIRSSMHYGCVVL